MKKVLLATTGLVGALSLSAAAHADGGYARPAAEAAKTGLTVTVGGFLDFQAGFTDQDSVFETGANSRDYKFQNDSEVHITAQGTADNGLVYGGVIELEADVTADADGEGLNADKTYLFLEGNFGRTELGNNAGAEKTLKVDASSIARATGGIDGDFYDFANLAGVAPGAFFIITPDLPSQHAVGITEDATKITYYTPRFSGFQAGVSFTPDTGNGGTAAGFSTDSDIGDVENNFGLGANYTGQFDAVSVKASLTGEFGSSEVTGIEDTQAWAGGLALSYQGFSVAGSYGDWDESGFATAANQGGNYYTLGAAYETGPFGVSVTYLNSEAADNDFTNLSVGADYQLAPGLVPYVEVNFFDADQTGTILDNDGSVILVGAELGF